LLIALGNTLMIGGWLLLSQNLFLWSELSQRFQAIGLANNISLGLFALYLIVFNPVVEEAFWRGLIYRNLRDRLGVGPALTLSSLFFGGWHFVIIQYFCPPLWAILLTCLVMAGGVVFGALYQRTGTLLAPILVHGLAGDLPIILILYGVLAQLPAT
jgi:membrane protease YdiL (CAAX protease family)